MPQPYIVIAIVSLAVIAFHVSKPVSGMGQKKLSRLAAIAFSLIVTGAVFGGNRWLGYSLIGAGIVLALDDIRNKHRGGSWLSNRL